MTMTAKEKAEFSRMKLEIDSLHRRLDAKEQQIAKLARYGEILQDVMRGLPKANGLCFDDDDFSEMAQQAQGHCIDD